MRVVRREQLPSTHTAGASAAQGPSANHGGLPERADVQQPGSCRRPLLFATYQCWGYAAELCWVVPGCPSWLGRCAGLGCNGQPQDPETLRPNPTDEQLACKCILVHTYIPTTYMLPDRLHERAIVQRYEGRLRLSVWSTCTSTVAGRPRWVSCTQFRLLEMPTIGM